MDSERWRQIEDLYNAVLAREPWQRSGLLDQADPEVRREVELLLTQKGSSLDHPAREGVTETIVTQAIPQRVVGRYEIEEQLGEGGMGVVYRALDTTLNRPVAIKFLSNEFADAAARHRFQREAQTASSLNHPHILTVYDAGEFEGRQYLVTEFVDGGTLKTWVGSGKRTWRQIVELLTGVADGLAAAHAAGILHRDIKPDNILISQSGYAKLADFGLAKLAEGPDTDLTRTFTEGRTRPGVIIGTIPYMSPEQAAGNRSTLAAIFFLSACCSTSCSAGGGPSPGIPTSRCCKPSCTPHQSRWGKPCRCPCAQLSKKLSRRTRPSVTNPCGIWWSI